MHRASSTYKPSLHSFRCEIPIDWNLKASRSPGQQRIPPREIWRQGTEFSKDFLTTFWVSLLSLHLTYFFSKLSKYSVSYCHNIVGVARLNGLSIANWHSRQLVILPEVQPVASVNVAVSGRSAITVDRCSTVWPTLFNFSPTVCGMSTLNASSMARDISSRSRESAPSWNQVDSSVISSCSTAKCSLMILFNRSKSSCFGSIFPSI